MKGIKYYLTILLSLICYLFPVGGIVIFFHYKTLSAFIIGCIIATIGLLLNKPITNLRIQYRQDVEYDEFGRSKTKGRYEYLSKKEGIIPAIESAHAVAHAIKIAPSMSADDIIIINIWY